MMEKTKILIIEDDPIIALSLSIFLAELKYNVVGTVNNAKEGWQKCLELQPDLVILDIHLYGEKKGYWVAQNIRRNNKNIKIIFVTAYNDNETVSELMKSSPDLYLTKPYSKEVLASNIQIALKKEYINTNFIEIKDGNSVLKIDLNEVTFIKSDSNYLYINFINKPKIVIREKLSNLESVCMDNNFIRTHLRYIVNEKHIKAYKTDELIVNNEKIPISRTYKHLIKDSYQKKNEL